MTETIVFNHKTGTIYKENEAVNENGEKYTTTEVIAEGVTAPTQVDRVEAQATYTAMMTDTLLEG